jgi:hypothetical protein
LVKDSFNKGELKHELQHAGFEECIADDIAERVEDRKMDGWTNTMGRDEAMREIDLLLTRVRQSSDNFKARNAPTHETMASPM